MPKLTDTQRAVFESIGTEWTSVADIARPNIARTLDSLERAGLIEQDKAHLATVSNGRTWNVRRKVPTSAEQSAVDSMAARVRNRPEPEPEPAPEPARDESAPAPAINPGDVLAFREAWNDYLDYRTFAADKGIPDVEAYAMIRRGRAAHDYGAPLARTLKAHGRDVVMVAGETTGPGFPCGLVYRPAGYRPAGSRALWRDSVYSVTRVVGGTPYGQEYPANAPGAYVAAMDYARRTRDVWAPGDKTGRTFAGIGFGILGWIERARDPRPGMESGVEGRPAHLIIGERADMGLLVTLAFEGESVSRVDIRPDEYRPTLPPRDIAREYPGA